VLIVDDDPALLQALPQALRLRNGEVTVETADSAAVALDRIAARDYDAIVTDIKDAGHGRSRAPGRDPAAPARHAHPHHHGSRRVRPLGACLRGGAYDFIQKPITGITSCDVVPRDSARTR